MEEQDFFSALGIKATYADAKPLPELGKMYHIFDDGKVRISRHYVATITDIISFDDACTDLKNAWAESVASAPWLFSSTNDYFVKARSDFDTMPLYFVRTLDGGWFSIDYPNTWMGARLDIDGTLYIRMLESNV